MSDPLHRDDEYWKEAYRREEQGFNLICIGLALIVASFVMDGIAWLIDLVDQSQGKRNTKVIDGKRYDVVEKDHGRMRPWTRPRR